MSLGVVAQRGNERAVALADRIRSDIGYDRVDVDAETGAALDVEGVAVDALSDCDLVVSIGGDGTFLFAARLIGETPLMGVNLGEVGFLTSVHPDDALPTVRDAFEAAQANALDARCLTRIEAHTDAWSTAPALNELMVHAPQRGQQNAISVVTRVDGEVYDRRRVDGLMVATPAGSTAYNLSERGPLVTPGVDGLVVNQMCAHGGRPPLIVPLDAHIEIAVTDAAFAYILGDGRAQHRMAVPGSVTIRQSPSPLRVAGPPVEFFQALDRLT